LALLAFTQAMKSGIKKIADAAQVSQFVVWTTGTTEGLRWEISHLLKSVPPAKLIVWAHPHLLRVDRAEREQDWSAFLARLGEAFPKALPERLRKSALHLVQGRLGTGVGRATLGLFRRDVSFLQECADGRAQAAPPAEERFLPCLIRKDHNAS
jgi:hypothetical protein